MARLTSMLIALALLSGKALAQYDGSPTAFPTSDIGIGLRQFGAAEGGGVCCLAVGYVGLIVAGLSFGEDAWTTPTGAAIGVLAALGSVALSPLGEAKAVCMVGDRFYAPEDRGSFGWTAGGAYLGALTALGIGIAGSAATHDQGWLPGAWYVPVLFLPQVGAVVGYHLSRPGPDDTGFLPARFDLPSVGLRKGGRRRAKGEIFPSSLLPSSFSFPSAPAFDLRLLSVHF